MSEILIDARVEREQAHSVHELILRVVGSAETGEGGIVYSPTILPSL